MAQLALTLFAIFAALMSSTEAQSVRSCSDVFGELSGKKIRVFVNPDPNRGLKTELCVDFSTPNIRLERYFYCPEGSDAFIPASDTANTRNDFSKVIDVDDLRDRLNTTSVLLLCLPRPTPPTPAPTTRPPPPSPPSLERCPRRPTRVNQYLRRDQSKLCRKTCSFGVAVFGIPTGTRTRTVYRCCEGEPILVSRASRLYSCP